MKLVCVCACMCNLRLGSKASVGLAQALNLSLNTDIACRGTRLRSHIVIAFFRRALWTEGGGAERPGGGAVLQPVVLHLGKRADGVGGPGAVEVRAAELGEVAAVRVGDGGQAAAQRRRVELARVGATLLQQLRVHVLPRLVDLSAACLLAHLAFALLPRAVFALVGAGGGASASAPGAALLHAAAAAVVSQLP